VQLLRNKLGPEHAPRILNAQTLARLLKEFEGSTKKDFNPYRPDCEDIYPINFTDYPDVPEVGIQGGYLRLRRLLSNDIMLMDREELNIIFMRVFNEILALIEQQVARVRSTWRGSIKVFKAYSKPRVNLDCVSGWGSGLK
jgi:hypothetical protein